MVKAKKEEVNSDKYSIITLTEYLEKVTGVNRVKESLRLIYNENEVLQQFEYKGEHYFVIKNKE